MRSIQRNELRNILPVRLRRIFAIGVRAEHVPPVTVILALRFKKGHGETLHINACIEATQTMCDHDDIGHVRELGDCLNGVRHFVPFVKDRNPGNLSRTDGIKSGNPGRMPVKKIESKEAGGRILLG
jgi:hypothetical protein